MRHPFRLCLLFALACPSLAQAEEGIIKNPGDHPPYRVELEPHAIFGFGNFFGRDTAPGLGMEATFIIVENGFVKTINNNVGIGVGVNTFFGPRVVFAIPVVMQWNFFLSTHWSVFGEPGIGIAAGDRTVAYPIFLAGGRYHFTERIALTMRVGYPWISVGVSFLF